MTFFDFTACLSVAMACYAIIHMCVIDLKIRILPNWLNGLLAISGLSFHASFGFDIIPLWGVLLGGLFGGGVLYSIRAVANRIYQMDTVGLGDVKLLAAGGLWLGAEHIMMALSVGAIAGLMHGVLYMLWLKVKTGEMPPFRGLTIPAGPGFATGIVLVAIWQYWPLLGVSRY